MPPGTGTPTGASRAWCAAPSRGIRPSTGSTVRLPVSDTHVFSKWENTVALNESGWPRPANHTVGLAQQVGAGSGHRVHPLHPLLLPRAGHVRHVAHRVTGSFCWSRSVCGPTARCDERECARVCLADISRVLNPTFVPSPQNVCLCPPPSLVPSVSPTPHKT